MTEVMLLDSCTPAGSYSVEILRKACDASDENATCAAPGGGLRG
jgi:hypothetical protein